MPGYYDINSAENPYANQAAGDEQALGNQQVNPWSAPQGPGQQGFQAYQPPAPGGPQNYPSYPNQFGLGSGNPNGQALGGTAPATGGASGPNFASRPVTVETPDTASRGMSPYDMVGAANVRENPSSPWSPPGGSLR